MNVLAGDIGGTKTLLRIVNRDGARQQLIFEARYSSSAFERFEDMLEQFRHEATPGFWRDIGAACFGVAGPVTTHAAHQEAQVTNLPWRLHSAHLAEQFTLPRVRLINDFAAIGYGIPVLGEEDLVTLQSAPARPQAPCLIIGAGTGLGVAQLFIEGNDYRVWASEGGHLAFSPSDEQHTALLRYLRKRHGRVSWERVVSGPGLVNIYSFLHDCGATSTQAHRQILAQEDPAAAIATAALQHNDPIARRALEMFVSLYGAIAGELALVTLAYGGVYLAGGIAPKLIDLLKQEQFLHAFTAKGRMARLVQDMPVHVVTQPQVGLMGAAAAAT